MENLGTAVVKNNELMVRCKDGWLVAGQMGDPGVYDEIVIYLRADDGRTLQLAVVGRDENEDSECMREVDKDWQPMHVYAYNGRNEDIAQYQYVKVDDDSDWY